MFYMDKDAVLTLSKARELIRKFKVKQLLRLKKLDSYYQNKNEAITKREMSDTTKPNIKINHSFANYITTTNTTMFLGSPVTYKGESDIGEYTKLLEELGEEDININLATNCSKYGYAIQLLYTGESKKIQLGILDNKEILLVYSDDIEHELLYVIRFWGNENYTDTSTEHVQIYSKVDTRWYRNDVLIGTENNSFSKLPIVIYKNNHDMVGDYENVLSLIDAYDLMESDSLNESEYFNSAYLYLNADTVDEEAIMGMKESRVLYGEGLNPQFITKNSQNADNDIVKNRLVSDIHKLSFTPDMSDNNFANNVSGVAMKYKLLGTLNNIANKQRKFKKALQERNKLMFAMMEFKNLKAPDDLDMVFVINMPQNGLEVAQMVGQLRGLVSEETLIAQLPFVDNPAEELERVNDIQSKGIPMYGDVGGGGFGQ